MRISNHMTLHNLTTRHGTTLLLGAAGLGPTDTPASHAAGLAPPEKAITRLPVLPCLPPHLCCVTSSLPPPPPHVTLRNYKSCHASLMAEREGYFPIGAVFK
ncbi:hypothetical protein J6590_013013 [Homalodisca vitripennis]|nr:hypothetical protein J6590_013013 [Homalodisca vitripennis]